LKNYYFILKISIYARDADIKRAYRQLAFQYHPDKNASPEAESIIKELNEAYEVLSDPQKKLVYDQQLITGRAPKVEPARAPNRDPRYRPNPAGYGFRKSSKKKELQELMQSYVPLALNISRFTLLCCVVLLCDFTLPVNKRKETIVELSKVYGGYGENDVRMRASDGKIYKLGKVTMDELVGNSYVLICTSPLLGISKRVENEKGTRYRIPVSIYGNFLFFPGIWLITSLLGVFYKNGIEFHFNLGLVNLLFVFFNLIAVYISS